MADATNPIRPRSPRWTHVALRVGDMDATIAWYEAMTPLRVLDRRTDAEGYGTWLGDPATADQPFVLVLVQFFPDDDPFKGTPLDTLNPFAHLGIELPERSDVDEAAKRAEAAGCLAMAPRELPAPVGYICMATDPDGNLVEFSHDQGVYAKAKEVWGGAPTS